MSIRVSIPEQHDVMPSGMFCMAFVRGAITTNFLFGWKTILKV